jgi:hypothetical protein
MSSVNVIKNLESLEKWNTKYIFNLEVISPPLVQVVYPEAAQLFKEYFLNQTCAIPDNVLSDTDHPLRHLCAQTFINAANV